MTAWRMGIDEAGRGCVIGPLVFGAYAIPAKRAGELARVGPRDSKALSHARRVALRDQLVALGGHRAVLEFGAPTLDRTNLGELTLQAIAELVGQRQASVIFLDAPVQPSGIARWTERVRQRLEGLGLGAIRIEASNRAEDRYPEVAAASILAKTRRDERLVALEERWGPIGSGYPSDPACRRFLERMLDTHGDLPPCVRRRWQTVQRLLEERRQPTLF